MKRERGGGEGNQKGSVSVERKRRAVEPCLYSLTLLGRSREGGRGGGARPTFDNRRGEERRARQGRHSPLGRLLLLRGGKKERKEKAPLRVVHLRGRGGKREGRAGRVCKAQASLRARSTHHSLYSVEGGEEEEGGEKRGGEKPASATSKAWGEAEQRGGDTGLRDAGSLRISFHNAF